MTPIFYQCVVIDNKDPYMLGRVRAKINVVNYPDVIKSVENWNPQTDPWSERDPLVFYPLMPYFVYQVPEEGELIQVIFTNPDFKYQNQYYVQSNFFSVNSTFNTDNKGGSKFTGTGMSFKPPRRIKNQDGSWPSNTIEKGLYPEPGDNAIIGRGSADLIVKKNEILLRAGKYASEPQSNTVNSVNNKRSFLQLTNFEKTKSGEKIEKVITTQEITLLTNYLIEYVIINPENTVNKFTGAVYLYSLKPSSSVNTDNLKISTVISDANKFLVYYEEFMALSSLEVINLINAFIKNCNNLNIFPTGTRVFSESQNKFPIFFRPSNLNWEQMNPSSLNSNNSIISQNLNTIFNGVKLIGSDPGGWGLIWKKDTTGIPTKIDIQSVTVESYVPQPYSVSILGGQKIYLLSQDSEIDGKKPINFANTIYGIPQSAVTKDIQVNTSSTVRGEELLELLNEIYQFLVTHTHAYPGLPPTKETQSGVKVETLKQLMQNAKNKILNSNIRVN